jgi:hypothetical protein
LTFDGRALHRRIDVKREDVGRFEKLKAQLDSLYQEISILAKKSPNDAVNAFKIRFVNLTLDEYNKCLGDRYKPFPGFETFSVEDMPSNSDVALIIAQHIECAEKFRADNIKYNYGDLNWYWKLDDKGEQIVTSAPKKITNK